MQYQADLFYFEGGSSRSIGRTTFDVVDQHDAIRLAQTWAAQGYAAPVGHLLHLLLVRDGQAVFSTTYGDA